MLCPLKLSLMSFHLPALVLKQDARDFWLLLKALFFTRIGGIDH